jgi:hypothetical protein
MDRLLRAALRTDLASFVRKVFATVSPGTRYCHNWHTDAIVYRPCGSTRATADGC